MFNANLLHPIALREKESSSKSTLKVEDKANAMAVRNSFDFNVWTFELSTWYYFLRIQWNLRRFLLLLLLLNFCLTLTPPSTWKKRTIVLLMLNQQVAIDCTLRTHKQKESKHIHVHSQQWNIRNSLKESIQWRQSDSSNLC